jgi:ATP-dependent Clp protease adaptor protein ClpS
MAKEYQITKTKTTPRLDVLEPSNYRVIYINDNTTTVDFVIDSLVEVFNHSEENAIELTDKVHNDGSATVAVLPYEIAEQKGVEVIQLARNNGFPLVVKLEVDE